MGLWNNDPNIMLVAGHRGARVGWPENTVAAFKYAISVGCDMVETDVRQTKDHELVLMHDALVDRTTDGHGRVQDMTLNEFRSLNAAAHVEGFAFEPPATLKELLELTAAHPSLLLNIEIKDYPHVEGEEWAFETVKKTIEMVEKYGLGKRIVLNSFSGKQLSYIHKKYGRKYPLHGFYPYFILGQERDNPDEYLDCACLFHVAQGENGENVGLPGQICPAQWAKELTDKGIEPWFGAGVKTYEDLKTCFEQGGRLVTSDDPAQSLADLRKMGHHK